MAFVSSYKAIVVTTPAAMQILKVAAISSPAVLLGVRTITTSAVADASDNMCAEVGVCDPDGTGFYAIPFAVIPNQFMRYTQAGYIPLAPDAATPNGFTANKPSWWAVRYRPGGYAGVIIWRAKVYFDVVK